MRWMIGLATAAAMICGFMRAAHGADLTWQRIKIDDTFRSEGAAAADFNRDGKVDVVAGDVWYEAPDWHMHALRPVGQYKYNGGYSESFCNFTHDVNGDGWVDVILVGFPGKPFHWYENPQNREGHWKEYVIWHSACNESPDFEDLTGDGKPEVILGSQPERQIGFLQLPEADRTHDKWLFVPVSRPGDPKKDGSDNGTHRFYHGLGIGDVNGDGRSDVVIPHGWWEAPEDRAAGPWTFHPALLSKPGEKNPLPAANIYVEDLDLDGDQDLMMSCAHSYGVWWFENVSPGKNDTFKYHVIDESFSQTHALEFVDLDGDGRRELITGKRYYAHNGHDPGAEEPVVMYWFEIKKTKGQPPQFIPHEIKEGLNTGVGTQFSTADVDGDGLVDVVLANKKGVNVLLQRRP